MTRQLRVLAVLGLTLWQADRSIATGNDSRPAAGPPVLSAGVFQQGKIDEVLSDLLNARLSKVEGIEIVERRAIELVFREWKSVAGLGDSTQRSQLGHLLGVDYFLWVTFNGPRQNGRLEIVDAQTGEDVLSRPLEVSREQPDRLADLVCKHTRDVLALRPIRQEKAAATVVFTKPQITPNASVTEDNVQEALSALMGELHKAGARLLHRRYVEGVISEHLWQEKGLVEVGSARRAFLGADRLIATRFEDETIRVMVVDPKTGQRLGQNEFGMGAMQSAEGRAGIVGWIQRAIQEPTSSATKPPVAASDGLQTETLTPLYEGILLHNQGKYFEASVRFADAFNHDTRLLPALRWLQSSYRLAGFQELGDAIESYLRVTVQEKKWWVGMANPKHVQAEPGVAFIGITADEHLSTALRVTLGMLVIDGLYTASGMSVLLTEDLANLRDEYDVLVGLENTQGTTWRKAPPFLLGDTVTAHLERNARGLRLRLCATQQLDPGQIRAREIELAARPSEWKQQIAATLDELCGPQREQSSHWHAPIAVIPETEDELLAQLRQQYRCDLHLKLLSRNPSRLEVFCQFAQNQFADLKTGLGVALKRGLQDWMMRHLPADDPNRPWFELIYTAVEYDEKLDVYLPMLRAFATRYANHPAGCVARFNLLLYDLTPDNIAEKQSQLEQLLPSLQRAVEGHLNGPRDWEHIEKMNRLLRCAAGKSEPAANLVGSCSVIHYFPWCGSDYRLYTLDKASGGLYTPKMDINAVRERCLVDAALYRYTTRREDIPVSVMKHLGETVGEHQDVQAYLFLTYGPVFFGRELYWPRDTEDMAAIYSKLADVLTRLLQMNPVPLTPWEAAFALRVDHAQFHHLVKNQPEFHAAYDKIRRAAVSAVVEGRFKKDDYGSVAWLYDVIHVYDDPECAELLRRRAEDSWRVGPLDDQFWLSYIWKPMTRAQRAELFVPYISRLHEKYDHAPRTQQLMEFYSLFAWTLMKGDRYDEARQLFAEITSWQTPEGKSPNPELKANALYLLAVLARRDGDGPGALRLAQTALQEIGENNFELYDYVALGSRGTYGKSNLKSLVTDFMGSLRRNEAFVFRNPFGSPEQTNR